MVMKCFNVSNKLFVRLVISYFFLFSGEGFLMMYLFNNVRHNGMSMAVSSLFNLVSYVPSLVVTLFIATSLKRRASLRFRLLFIAIARALICVLLAVSSNYLGVVEAVLFIVVMEILWYALMPCLDELENMCIHNMGVVRGEAILTIALQLGLSISLVTGGFFWDFAGPVVLLIVLGCIQVLPAILLLSVDLHSYQIAEQGCNDVVGDSKNESVETKQVDKVNLYFLLVALGITAAIAQLVNIVFPVKIFAITSSSAVAGGIDASYNVGALLVACLGLTAVFARTSSPVSIALGLMSVAVSLVIFSVARHIAILAIIYFVIGFMTTMSRVRIRATIFNHLRGVDESIWFTRITNVTLLVCTMGASIMGVGALCGVNYWGGYLFIAGLALCGTIFSVVAMSSLNKGEERYG